MQPIRTEISSLGEFGLIDLLTQDIRLCQPSTIKGVGDDAAVIDHKGKKTVVSTDMLVEGIHFDLTYTPLKHLGYKSVAVNVSDIYAMNARPTQITLSIAVSNRFSVEALQEFYAGVYAACKAYEVDLVGGDTTSSRLGFVISVTAIGEADTAQIVYRSGAQVGDLICATGDFGAAYMGLQLLEREKQIYLENKNMQPDLENKAHIVGKLLKPEARKDIYESLQKISLIPTAMMDVSDGISSEVHHLCKQSQVGAIIEEAALCIHPETYHQALDFGIDATTCALNGGEDYELLFTIRPQDADKIKYLLDIRIIGECVPPADGIHLHSKGGNIYPLLAQGWQHNQ